MGIMVSPNGFTILVVEDNEASRKPLTRLLRQAGYHVLTAETSFEATAAVRNLRPDLMLLDVGIPPLDGLTMLMLLQQERPRDCVPVILVTGYSDGNTASRARQLGVKAHLVKSQFEPEELLSLIKQHLPARKADAQPS